MSESMNRAVSRHQVRVRAEVQYSQHRMIHTPTRSSLIDSWRFHLRAYLPERNSDPFVCLGGSGTSSPTPDPRVSAVTLLDAKDGSSIRYSCSLFLRTSPLVSVHSLTHVQQVQGASYISLKPLSAGGSYVRLCTIRTRTEGWTTSDVQTGASFATSSGGSLNTPEAALQRRECHGFTSGGESVTIFDLVTKPLPFGLPLPFLSVFSSTQLRALKVYWPGVRVIDPPILNTRFIESCKQASSPGLRPANPIFPSPLSAFRLWLLEVSFLHHLPNLFLVEGEKITALIHHPSESDVGYVTWDMVIVASSHIGMHAREPTLLETSASFGSIDLLGWEIPECRRE